MFKYLFFIISSAILSLANASQWVEEGLVCGVGNSAANAEINLSKKMDEEKLYAVTSDSDYSSLNTKTDKYIMKPKGKPYDIIDKNKVRDVSWGEYDKVACYRLRGSKPTFNKNYYFDCKRKDKSPEVHLNLESNKDFYIDSQGIKKYCVRKESEYPKVILDCAQNNSESALKSKITPYDKVTLNHSNSNVKVEVCSIINKHESCEPKIEGQCDEVMEKKQFSSPPKILNNAMPSTR